MGDNRSHGRPQDVQLYLEPIQRRKWAKNMQPWALFFSFHSFHLACISVNDSFVIISLRETTTKFLSPTFPLHLLNSFISPIYFLYNRDYQHPLIRIIIVLCPIKSSYFLTRQKNANYLFLSNRKKSSSTGEN